jgi:hypothetical protein
MWQRSRSRAIRKWQQQREQKQLVLDVAKEQEQEQEQGHPERELHVVVHLDVERGFDRVWLRMVKAREVWSVDGCAWEEGRWKWR